MPPGHRPSRYFAYSSLWHTGSVRSSQANTSSLSILASTNDLNKPHETVIHGATRLLSTTRNTLAKAEAGLKNPCLQTLQNVSGLEIFVAVILQRWLRGGLSSRCKPIPPRKVAARHCCLRSDLGTRPCNNCLEAHRLNVSQTVSANKSSSSRVHSTHPLHNAASKAATRKEPSEVRTKAGKSF